MKFASSFAIGAAALSLIFTLPARSATGMAALQYYVGTWSCTGGTIGKPPGQATLTYTMNGDVLQVWIKAPKGYVQSSSRTYDSKNNRYVDAGVANNNNWFVTYITLSGNTETSIDHAGNGTLGHGTTVRTSSSAFTYTGYPTLAAVKPDFKVACRKS